MTPLSQQHPARCSTGRLIEQAVFSKSVPFHFGSLQPLLQTPVLFTQQIGRRVFVVGLRLRSPLAMPLSETSGRNPDNIRCGLERAALPDHKINSIPLELITERATCWFQFL
jgi:hypothetical protein